MCAYVLLAPCVYSFLWLSIYGGLGPHPHPFPNPNPLTTSCFTHLQPSHPTHLDPHTLHPEPKRLSPTAGIKMERLTELALNVKPDWENGTIDCAVPLLLYYSPA